MLSFPVQLPATQLMRPEKKPLKAKLIDKVLRKITGFIIPPITKLLYKKKKFVQEVHKQSARIESIGDSEFKQDQGVVAGAGSLS